MVALVFDCFRSACCTLLSLFVTDRIKELQELKILLKAFGGPIGGALPSPPSPSSMFEGSRNDAKVDQSIWATAQDKSKQSDYHAKYHDWQAVAS